MTYTSSNTFAHVALALLTACALQACSGDDTGAAPKGNNDGNGPGWMLGANADPGDMDAFPDGPEDSVDFGLPPANNTSPANNGFSPDMDNVSDFGGPIDVGMPPDPVDMTSPADMAPPADMSQTGITQGNDCGTTNECAQGLVCCPSFGSSTCEPERRCRVGGICQDDSECPGNQSCCDFSQFGSPDNVCRDSCGGGMGQMGCQNNMECTGADEVCCPSFNAAPECKASSQCQSGGLCSADSDCINGQSCCSFGGRGICFDQCSF